MKYEYEATFRVNLGTVLPEIGDLMDKINTGVANAGYDESKLALTTDGFVPPLIVTVERELTQEEQHKVKTLIEAEVIQAFPKYDVRLASFRRKSGNVAQLVMQ